MYVNAPSDLSSVKKTLEHLQGVESVLTRNEAVKEFHLQGSHIGDLVVIGDEQTVFGNLTSETEELPASYRSHGSIHEARVPLFVYHAVNAPSSAHFSYNYQLADWLY